MKGAAAAPVSKRRRGFFSQPTEKEVKKAKEKAKDQIEEANSSSHDADSKANDKGKKTEGHSDETEGDVFRNVIHELKDRGLPVEMHYARTDDGYWIPVVRVPAKGDALTDNAC